VTWVYFLLCKSGRLYTGVSEDPLRRFLLHASGAGARSLRGDPPLGIVGASSRPVRRDALSWERRLKRYPKVRKWSCAWMARHSEEWAGYVRQREKEEGSAALNLFHSSTSPAESGVARQRIAEVLSDVCFLRHCLGGTHPVTRYWASSALAELDGFYLSSQDMQNDEFYETRRALMGNS
jgi:putative endonuclease